MRVFISVLLFLLCPLYCSLAQEVLWANKVLEKSSETVDAKYSPKYRAIQVLGPPSILPLTGSSPCSWRPLGVSYGEDYIKVGFAKAIKVRQIIIGETIGPGAVGRIFGYTADNKEILLYQNSGNNTRKNPGIWNEFIAETAEEINAIKILIVHSLNKGPKEYDCIGISNSSEPYVAKINLAEGLPDKLEKQNLGPNINSKYSEVAPLVSPDGKYLYFTRLDHPKNSPGKVDSKNPEQRVRNTQDVWVSKLGKNGEWELAKNMSKPIHDGSKNAASTIAMDGKSIYAINVKLPNGNYDAGLTKVTLKDNQWTDHLRVNIDDFEALHYYNLIDNESKRETEFSMSADEKFLVMGLVRKETYGDKDLYVSFKIGENHYSKPINLGSTINTAGNEGSPFLAADNKTLYFNSNGHPGYGDMDIFVTTRLDDTWTNWSKPVNLGPQINSPQFDGYISIPASGEFAYYSSAKNSMGLDDLFKVRLVPGIKPEAVIMLEMQFVAQGTKNVLVPGLSLQSESNEPIKWVFDDESQSFKSVLSIGKNYRLKTNLQGYKSFELALNYANSNAYKEDERIIELIPEEVPVVQEVAKPIEVITKEEVEVAKQETENKPKVIERETEYKAEVPPKVASKPEVKTPPVLTEKPAEVVQNVTSVKDLPLEAGKKMVLNEIYFDQSKADLREESFVELNRIKRLMFDNPTMEILLEGHTDNQGDADLNFKLAQERVNNVKDFLTKDGQINPNRISIKSWGQYRPLMKNTSEESRMKNRRVEFTILKM